ncbi:MAG: alpha/beta hydrolase [Acidobacteria bacterium]|nr:alpha/beta hydrolase [Acidobacteriota bacterium]
MNEDARQDHVSKLEVVYRIPGMEQAVVRRDVVYKVADAGALTMDIYRPPGSADVEPPPAVVIVAGYPDPGFERAVGCKFKEMGSTVSWARLFAASGLAAITYASREPEADLGALLRHVRQNADALGVDGGRVGLWACSGNVPVALSALMREGDALRCAALCYGYMLDLEGSNVVAEAAKKFGFANPCAGRSVCELPKAAPLFVARAGRDEMPRLNETIDRFLVEALANDLPLTFVNLADAPHAFDLFNDCEKTREIVRQILTFLQSRLTTPPARSTA